MHDQLTGTAGLDRLGAGLGPAVVVEAEPHLGRYRHRRRHGLAHGRHQAMQQLGVLQQRRATAMAIHDLGRAAEVQVDAGRAEAGQPRGVLGQAVRVRAHQLRAYRHAGCGASALVELGHDAAKGAFGQQRAGDADELGDAEVDAAHARERVAQRVVEQPFHGREQDGHDVAVDPGTAIVRHRPVFSRRAVLARARTVRRPSR